MSRGIDDILADFALDMGVATFDGNYIEAGMKAKKALQIEQNKARLDEIDSLSRAGYNKRSINNRRHDLMRKTLEIQEGW